MPDDLRKQIIEAIAASGDENYKRLLLLLLRVEEIFLDRVDELTNQLTVPVQEHSDDHAWVKSSRAAGSKVSAAGWKILISIVEKGALVAAGAIALKLTGGV
jgi:hypothetical protein